MQARLKIGDVLLTAGRDLHRRLEVTWPPDHSKSNALDHSIECGNHRDRPSASTVLPLRLGPDLGTRHRCLSQGACRQSPRKSRFCNGHPILNHFAKSLKGVSKTVAA